MYILARGRLMTRNPTAAPARGSASPAVAGARAATMTREQAAAVDERPSMLSRRLKEFVSPTIHSREKALLSSAESVMCHE